MPTEGNLVPDFFCSDLPALDHQLVISVESFSKKESKFEDFVTKGVSSILSSLVCGLARGLC